MKGYLQSFVSLLYPNLCLGCDTVLNQKEEVVCTHCLLDFPKLDYHETKPNPIVHDLFNAHKVSNAYAYLKYNKEGIAQKLLYELKYAENRKVGEFLGRMMGYDIRRFVNENQIDLMIPVPIHKSKRKTRGYNQTEVLALSMTDILNIEVNTTLLARNISVESQAKKGKMKRWANIEKQYFIKERYSLEGRKVLILDDVITTGATVTVLINLISELKPTKIYVACVATGK